MRLEASARITATAFEESPGGARRWGYEDGFYGDLSETFAENLRLASLEDPENRLEYYRGHRAGRSSRSDGTIRAA